MMEGCAHGFIPEARQPALPGLLLFNLSVALQTSIPRQLRGKDSNHSGGSKLEILSGFQPTYEHRKWMSAFVTNTSCPNVLHDKVRKYIHDIWIGNAP